MSDNCLFCKIIAGDIPAKIAYEDEHMIAFSDIAPRAPVHLLLVPKRHVENLMTATEFDRDLLSHMLLTSAKIAQSSGLKAGYRLVTNSGEGGRQEVSHLHFHVMGDIRDAGYRPL